MDSDTADALRQLRLGLARIAAAEAVIEAERSRFDAAVAALAQQPGLTKRGLARELGFRSDNAVRRACERAAARKASHAASPAHVAQGLTARDNDQHS